MAHEIKGCLIREVTRCCTTLSAPALSIAVVGGLAAYAAFVFWLRAWLIGVPVLW
jgi:hypothetical protein